MTTKKRVFWIMADSLGVGAMPDAKDFKPLPGGDVGSNTLAHLIEKAGGIKAPTLQHMGLANILVGDDHPKGHPLFSPIAEPIASFGKMAELSAGKDTPSGHWEMAGVPLDYQMPVYYQGLPQNLLDRFVAACEADGIDLPGVLGGQPASGTVILEELGEEHIKTGKPIVYTSGDSVFQVAAHEQHFGLEKLYRVCEIAREVCNQDDERLGRVIARPFVGNDASDFKRTSNRRDYSLKPPRPTILDAAKEQGKEVISIGKIADIFAHQGFTQKFKSQNNRDGMNIMTNLAKKNDWEGIAFVNLVDFDMLYGHRRNAVGYRDALQDLDADMVTLLEVLGPNDLVLISADHGCDPTFAGTDHTREYVPILSYQKGKAGRDLGTRKSFADVAASIRDFLQIKYNTEAESFYA